VPTTRAAATAALALLVIAGCGGGSGDPDSPAANLPPPGASGDQSRKGQRVLTIPDAPPPGIRPTLPGNGAKGSFEGVNFRSYERSLNYTLFLINDYWKQNFPASRSRSYRPPQRVIAYYPDTRAPFCGGAREPPGNADFCANGRRNFVSFDEPGFMVPYYRKIGPVANATILAHEWGHLIQDRLGLLYDVTVEKELNADCLAGVWSGHAVKENQVDLPDLNEARRQLIAIGDQPGVPWTGTSTHGTGPQRVRAFLTGLTGGLDGCTDHLAPGFSKDRPGVVP
jgi:predicted metalloprotease